MQDIANSNIILNNKIINVNDISNSLILDGFNVYDVMRIKNSTPLFYEEHYLRLKDSSIPIKVDIWLSEKEIRKYIIQLSSHCGITSGNIKIIFSYNEEKTKRNFIAYFVKTKHPKQIDYKNGISVLTLKAERYRPNIKLINKDLRETANRLIKENDVYEIILIDRNGNITEGSRSNIFLVQNNEIFTSPLKDVLPGITRSNIFKICKNFGIKLTEKKIPLSSIKNLDGVFITGTSPKVLPVSKIDVYEFNSESILLHTIIKEYDKMIEEYLN